VITNQMSMAIAHQQWINSLLWITARWWHHSQSQ
jgi:hypothetical protein